MAKTTKRKRAQQSHVQTERNRQDDARRELKRRLRAAREISRLERALERAVQKADRDLRAFAQFIAERDGDDELDQKLTNAAAV